MSVERVPIMITWFTLTYLHSFQFLQNLKKKFTLVVPLDESVFPTKSSLYVKIQDNPCYVYYL